MLGKKFTLELLLILKKEPLRFVDLESLIPNESTRADRIKELEKLKYIEPVMKKVGKRACIGYQLTKKGERILKTFLKK